MMSLLNSQVSRFSVAAIIAVLVFSGGGVQANTLPDGVFPPPPHELMTFSDRSAVRTDLNLASAALNSVGTLSGQFVQTDSMGEVKQGNFYIKKPGKFRFEYMPVGTVLMVSDGVTMTMLDQELELEDRIPLKLVPISYFLKNNVDLERDTEVVGLVKHQNGVFITAKDGSGEADAIVTIVMSADLTTLQGWAIEDGMGSTTYVSLQGAVQGERLSPRLFLIENSRERRRR